MATLKILACVLCEEVRQEASGQSILIGAINRGPSVDPESETLVPRIAFYIEAVSRGVEEMSLRLASANGNDVAFQDNFKLGIRDTLEEEGHAEKWEETEANMQLVVNLADVKIPHSGKYQIEMAYDGKDWEIIRDYVFFPRTDTEGIEH